MDWLQIKLALAAASGLDRDAMHIYAGVLVQLAAALLLRRKLGDWLPWFVVLVVTAVGEVADVYVDIWPDHALQAGKAIHDFVNTLAVPTFLLLVSRYASGIVGRS